MSTPQPYLIAAGLYYICNPMHRTPILGKSQWTILPTDEVDTFRTAYIKTWLLAHIGWGLYYKNQAIDYLGLAQDHITKVFLAKFVNDQPHNTWHGYPADYQRNPQDIPDLSILKLWLQDGILPQSKISKIVKAKPCKL